MKTLSVMRFARMEGLFLALLLVVPVMAVSVSQSAFAQGLTIHYDCTRDAGIEKMEVKVGSRPKLATPIVWVNLTVKNTTNSKMGFEPIVRVDDGPAFAGGKMGLLIDPGKSKVLKTWAPVKSRSLPKKIELTITSTTWE